jgi:hypothetical protein
MRHNPNNNYLMQESMAKQRSPNVILKGFAVMAAMVIAVAMAGCASIGPGTIAKDRFDYDHAVTTSWKRMMLLNLVKMRYGDTPMFLDVSSIINSYSLEGEVSLGASWETGVDAVDTKNLGGTGRYSDKPTITYNPLFGERFTRSLMTPIQPAVVVSLVQSGWPADKVMQLMVSSANGVQNRYGVGARSRGADPEYYQFSSAMRRIQASGAVGLRVAAQEGREVALMVLQGKKMTPELQEDSRKVREILDINREAKDIRVVYGSAPANDSELALLTRSMLEILMDIASSIEVPQSHVKDGTVTRTAVFDTDAIVGYSPPIRIHSGLEKPDNAFVSIPYGGHWYWIDNRDYPSKSLFSFLMIIFSLTDTGSEKGQPVVTIPAG